MNKNDLIIAIRKSWNKDTAFPRQQSDWTSDNPALGQCAITALVVQDYLGGEIMFNKQFAHYWNKLPDGEIFDLTKEQFGENVLIESEGVADRDYILLSPRAKEFKTPERYELLRSLVKKLYNAK